ncbi:Regulatory protein LEU3 [Lachnellula suecica]|uniref:Regulatory protein LEU3 n=1 Tax=Lachnellula suecica TaxID=602035 RepID=A0A8T9C3Q5_9HELO|nr:Regulatory protein LEU3 [Lachnellula suecica]
MEHSPTMARPAVASPTATRPGTANSSKRKRTTTDDGSPGSEGGDDNGDGRHIQRTQAPPTKRACNECRQQKLRCNVQQDPFHDCDRCTRLKLHCEISNDFKRVGKRTKHAEMEHQLVEQGQQISRYQRMMQRAVAQGFIADEDIQSPVANGSYSNSHSYMGSDEAVSSLLHLKQGGGPYGIQAPRFAREIEGVGLTQEAIDHLFNEFWNCYHPYLPFLDPAQAPDAYYQQHPLLFWVIIAVSSRRYTKDPSLLTAIAPPLSRLLWATVGEVPNTHYVVKALCLLCTWPLPTSTTSTDPSHILGGVMMKTATGIGLHRPKHTQDFSRVNVDLNREQLHDRVTTWAVCNIVAQNLGTGYGQPASTLYDWTLAVRPGEQGPYRLSGELEARLQIERFCDKVSKEMYSNASDPRGVAGDDLRATLTRVYRREFGELQASILSDQNLSPIVNLYLKAAGLHLRLSAFFDSSTTQGYMDDLMGLWRAANAFLDVVFDLEPVSAGVRSGRGLRYATNYILQMIIAACFTLLKLLSSFFAREIDFDQGRLLFHKTIDAIRSMSVINNDLPWRLAELMVQLYNGARIEARNRSEARSLIDDSLQLKVRCRMSMSLVFDSTWRWREEFQAQGLGNLEGQNEFNSPSAYRFSPPAGYTMPFGADELSEVESINRHKLFGNGKQPESFVKNDDMNMPGPSNTNCFAFNDEIQGNVSCKGKGKLKVPDRAIASSSKCGNRASSKGKTTRANPIRPVRPPMRPSQAYGKSLLKTNGKMPTLTSSFAPIDEDYGEAVLDKMSDLTISKLPETWSRVSPGDDSIFSDPTPLFTPEDYATGSSSLPHPTASAFPASPMHSFAIASDLASRPSDFEDFPFDYDCDFTLDDEDYPSF